MDETGWKVGREGCSLWTFASAGQRVFLFGGAISGNWHLYLQTLVPGLMVQNTLFASMGTGYSLSNDISKGVFDRFRSLPIARSAPLVGAVIGDAVRFVVAMIILLGFAGVMGGGRGRRRPQARP